MPITPRQPPPAAPDVVDALAQVAGKLQKRLDELTDGLSAVMAREIEGLDEDPVLVDLLWNSVESNVSTILYGLANNVPTTKLQPPSAAVEYARRLAQRGVPSNSLVRAYHMGQHDLLNEFYPLLDEMELPRDLAVGVLRHGTALVFAYIDWISIYVFDVYEQERKLWLGTAGNIRSALIHGLLRDPTADTAAFEAQTGYRLGQHHLGAVIWSDSDQPLTPASMDTAATGLARAIGAGGDLIATAVDQETLWVWIPLGDQPPRLDTGALRAVLSLPPSLHIAVGLPAGGVHGFRRSHEQAIAAYEVATVQQDPSAGLVGFGDRGIALTSLLAANLDSTRAWVREVLGPLADDTENAAVLRQTLGTFFATGESHLHTAEKLNLHRNTVKYRVDKALAGPRIHDRLDIALALQVCEFLGPTVLRG
ncbi:MAG: helix-turn-helix domain-containing protein [Gordonia sp. (in: high G+C Gram-positive bacteria)]|uniref:PucR family transcriptional regulator n=1 Tax=Gordonia sp. (in: high G+C Gram-positive bacteria) TaxID=84139 RepID=UPI0039E4209D